MQLVTDTTTQTINDALARLVDHPATSINGAQCIVVTQYKPSRLRPTHGRGIIRSDDSNWYRFTVLSNWDRRKGKYDYLGREFAYLSSKGELAVQVKRTHPKRRPVLFVINPTTYPNRYLRLLLEGVNLLGYDGNLPTIVEVKEPTTSSALKLIGWRTYYDRCPLLQAGINSTKST